MRKLSCKKLLSILILPIMLGENMNAEIMKMKELTADQQRIVKDYLADFGGDVNGKAENGWSPLFCAVIAGNISVAKLLIQHGIDVNAKNEKGGRCCMVLRNC